MASIEKHFTEFNSSRPLTHNNGEDHENSSQQRESLTIQSIEDATGRLSNLVRLMEENSKVIQPSDLTVQSYQSQSQVGAIGL